MSALANTQAHRAARNAASIALADTGAGNALPTHDLRACVVWVVYPTLGGAS